MGKNLDILMDGYSDLSIRRKATEGRIIKTKLTISFSQNNIFT